MEKTALRFPWKPQKKFQTKYMKMTASWAVAKEISVNAKYGVAPVLWELDHIFTLKRWTKSTSASKATLRIKCKTDATQLNWRRQKNKTSQ